MAISKKKASKKQKSAAKPAPKRAKATAARLTSDDRARKLYRGDDQNELVGEVLTAWELVATKVRVPGVTGARLRSLMKKANKATDKEAAIAAKQASKLAPLADARIVANDEVYRAALAVKRVADAIAATDPSVAEAFEKVTARFRRSPWRAHSTDGPNTSGPTSASPRRAPAACRVKLAGIGNATRRRSPRRDLRRGTRSHRVGDAGYLHLSGTLE